MALVTGSTSGIGLGIARRLTECGYRVILHSRSSRDVGAALATELATDYVQADLADDDERRRLIKAAVEVAGHLDVLVNNAGVSAVVDHRDLRAANPDLWRDMYEVNAIAPFRLVAEAEEHLRAAAAEQGRPGSVVNIASHAGIRPKGASIPYAASKAALIHTSRLLAVALAPDIRVNAVAPGLVDTPMTERWADAQALWRERAPMRRAATPDDIAATVLSLIESDYVTGECVVVDGGLGLV